ncbi:MAG: hypothetical protein DRP93_08935, partial [Candidatus Neomarinimicrobiota bacterium]
MSLNHFFKTFGEIEYLDTENWSLKASLSGKQYIFFANSTFYQINGKWFHLPTTIERLSYGLYIPEKEFIRVLKLDAFPDLKFNIADNH